MASFWFAGILLACFTSSVFSSEDNKSVKARLEVKAFINDDAGKYPDLEVKYIGGIDPRMLFLNDAGEETERVALAEKTRDEINDLLASQGLTRRVESNDIEEAGKEDDQKEDTSNKVEAGEEDEQKEDTSNKVEF